MESKGMINCPNCNKRTFGDKKECIYCKYILNDEHNFDSQIYNFLYDKYNENPNKPEIIKLGMEKFGLTMKEIKVIVDHISELFSQNEEAKRNKGVIENHYKIIDDLPTNGIDYSKYVNNSGYTAHKKNFIIKLLGVFLCWIIAILMCVTEFVGLEIKIVMICLCIILLFKLVIRETIPQNPHTFVFSFFQFFIRCILPMFISIVLIVLMSIQIIKNVANYEPIIVFISLVTFVICVMSLVKFGRTGEFTAYYGHVIYRRTTHYNAKEKRSTEEEYVIYHIKEVKETLNSIIIYGDIGKRYYEKDKFLSNLSQEVRINKLRVMKTFKNNRNLIKSLQILVKK